MRMFAELTDMIPGLDARMDRARRAGLIAAAYVLANAVKRALAGGYTSGAFVTGNVINSVTVADPEGSGDSMSIQVGSDVDYALFWELGHHNIFTRRYERQERWQPALVESREACAAAYARGFKRAFAEASDASSEHAPDAGEGA